MGKEQDLLDACRSGHQAIVDKILSGRLKKGGPLNLTSLRRLPGANTTDPRNGFTCLHYASLNGHKNIVRLLLEHGANPNVVDHNGSSPLHLAAWTGDYEIVELLTNIVNSHQKADINLANKDNETALHSACQYGHTAVVSLLLTKGANPRIRNVRGETPLDLSAQYGRSETVEMLLALRVELIEEYSPNRRLEENRPPRHSPLHLASRNGHKTIVKLLLGMGFDVNYLTQNGTALHEAVLCGKVEVVAILLQAGADINLENEHGQKVNELLVGVNTSVAKQTRKMLHDYVYEGRARSSVGRTSSLVSPVSEMDPSSATLHASNSFCDQEDLTLVDSMLNEEVALYAHDFEPDELVDERVPCISPPPGYTDNPGCSNQFRTDDDDDARFNNPSCYIPSPTSSLFSASIFSELASIFEKDFQNRVSGDDHTSYESSDDLAGMKSIKPSMSFTSSDFGNGSPLLNHHKSFDAMWKGRQEDRSGEAQLQLPSQPAMSSSLNSGCASDYGGGDERYRYSMSNAEFMQSSNYSISSSVSNVLHQSQQPSSSYMPPPKPPRKSIRSNAHLCTAQLEPAKSDFNVNYVQHKARNNKDDEKTAEDVDSEEASNSQRLNSVISKQTNTKEENVDNSQQHVPTLAMSIDDFYMLYDQIAKTACSPIKSMHRHTNKGGSKSIDLDYEHNREVNKENTPPPSPPGVVMAEEDVVTVIEKLKSKYAEIQPPKRKKRKKRSSTEPIRTNTARLVLTNELLNNKRDSCTATTDGEVIIVQDRGDGITSGGALVEPSQDFSTGVIEKRSVAIETERRPPQTKQLVTNGAAHKSQLYSAYCETLKFDGNGEEGNPFAGLCRGGLTPKKKPQAKPMPTSQSSLSMSSETKKKMVHLNETRKSLRRQRSLLSGRAESLSKLDSGGGNRLSVYNGSHSRSVTADYDIYAPLRRKKKCKSLNGETHLLEVYGKELDVDGETPEDRLLPWLKRIHMHQYKELLVSNGYDDLAFMDASVMNDSDLLAIGIINAAHRETILRAAAQLPPSWKLNKSQLASVSLQDWLEHLRLSQYAESFRRHQMCELKKIRNVWEVELETVFDIDKIGHRRRIMNSFAEFSRESILMDDDAIASWLSDATNGSVRNDSEGRAKEEEKENRPSDVTTKTESEAAWKGWKHARQELTSGACIYNVCYLGSTLVRELRGIDSTRASIGKLKLAVKGLDRAPNILLVISCKGVQFKDNHNNKLICEHEIRNIHCICQDSEDLNYFAYITKDFETNQHYCHVFMSPQTDLVTEIILTLGQAFEIAYQIVLEQFNLHAAAVAAAAINSSMATSGSMQTSSGSDAAAVVPEKKTIAPGLEIKYRAPINIGETTQQAERSKQSCETTITVTSKQTINEAQQQQQCKYNFSPPMRPHQSTLRGVESQQQSQQRDENERKLQAQAKKPVEEIYAVVDRSKKLRFTKAASLSLSTNPPSVGDVVPPPPSESPAPPPLSSRTSSLKSCASLRFVEQQQPQAVSSSPRSTPSPNDRRPAPPRRSSSSSSAANTPNASLQRPELKPKPPTRIASMHGTANKPEVSPKPKNLLVKSHTSPVPPPLPLHSTNSLHAASKPSIAAKPLASVRRSNTNPRQLSAASQWSTFGQAHNN